MRYTKALSVIGRLYSGRVFRICVSPKAEEKLPEVFYLEKLRSEPAVIRQDNQGILCCQRGAMRFLYDPPTGGFKVNSGHKEILSGKLQTGLFDKVLFSISLAKKSFVYGFGPIHGSLSRNGQSFLLMNGDSESSSPSSCPSSFPFFIIRQDTDFVGIFWNSPFPAKIEIKSETKGATENGIHITTPYHTEPMTQDFFIFRGNLPKILKQYAMITGTPLLPPIWSLGFHYSRLSCKTAADVLKTAERFRREKIPCDSIHLDIHSRDKLHPFTWHPRRFPDPSSLHQSLRELGFRTVMLAEPAIPIDKNSELYEDVTDKQLFCKDSKGENYIGRVRNGKTVIPDFTIKETRNWWADLHLNLFSHGVSGMWYHQNSPLLKRKKHNPLLEDIHHKEQKSHHDIRNIYANCQIEASKNAFQKNHPSKHRPLLLTQSAFCGIQKSAFVWLESSTYSWKELPKSLHMLLNLNLSGAPFCGMDFGNFDTGSNFSLLSIRRWRNHTELFQRWLEFASLMPLFRFRSILSLNPWSFGKKTLALCKKHISRRYQFLPYYYTLANQIHRTGEAWMRPMFYDFPEIEPKNEREQFLIGRSLLAAPVFSSQMKQRAVYLPSGKWYEFETGTRYNGKSTHYFKIQQGYYPLFIKEGTILPLCYPQENTESTLKDTLIFEIYPARSLSGQVYLDDGISQDYQNGSYTHIELKGEMNSDGSISIQLEETCNKYHSLLEYLEFRLPPEYSRMETKSQVRKKTSWEASEEGRSILFSSFHIPYRTGTFMFYQSQ